MICRQPGWSKELFFKAWSISTSGQDDVSAMRVLSRMHRLVVDDNEQLGDMEWNVSGV